MRRAPLLVAATCLLLFLTALAGVASASPVTLVGRDGHVRTVNNPYLDGALLATPAAPGPLGLLSFTPGPPSPHPALSTRKRKQHPKAVPVTVKSRLAALEKSHQISTVDYHRYLNEFDAALSEERQLGGWRGAQLAEVTVLLHQMAVSAELTAQRLPVLFLTLSRNAQYWRRGAYLQYPDRVQFQGSELVWEYYPGYGLQLQVLGTFGEADGFYEAGRGHWPQLLKTLAQMLPLAVRRGSALTWEYDFGWEGGEPGWVSAMAQGTALEAIANAYQATGDRSYAKLGARLLPLLTTPPPTGVGQRTSLGLRYLQYSFAPSTYIINAFMQTLIGLHHFALATGSKQAATLFDEGNREAEHELPGYVVVGWSLYQPGVLDDYNYHVLVTGFARQLCAITSAPIYCGTYKRFSVDLTSRPQLHQLTSSTRTKHPFELRFRLSKVATVGAVVTGANGSRKLYTSAMFPSGVRAFAVPSLGHGTYKVTLTATDLAGNRTQIRGTLTACKKGRCPQ